MVVVEISSASASVHWNDLKLDVVRDMLDLEVELGLVHRRHRPHDWHFHGYHWEAVEAVVMVEEKTDLTHCFCCSSCQVEHDDEEAEPDEAEADYVREDDTVEHVETDHRSPALEVNVALAVDHVACIEEVN